MGPLKWHCQLLENGVWGRVKSKQS